MPSWLGPSGPGRQRRRAPRTSSASVAPRSGRGRCRSTRAGRHGPAIIWMDSRGARAVSRETVRGALNVQGYSASSWPSGCAAPAASRACRARTRSGTSTSCASSVPTSTPPPPVFLEPVDYLGLRLTGLARASHDSITWHWMTDNRDINAIAYDDSLARWPASSAPAARPGADGHVMGGLAPAAAAELGLLPGTPVVAGTGDLHSAAVGSGAVADFDGHLYIGTSAGSAATSVQEDRPADQHRVDPLGYPWPLPGGRRARDGGRLPDLAARQHALPDDAPRGAPPRPTTSSPPSTTWRPSVPVGSPMASCSRPG